MALSGFVPLANAPRDRLGSGENRSRDTLILLRLGALAFELRPDGTVLSVNEAVQTATGYGALEGSNWWNLFFPGARAAEAERLRRRLSESDVDRAPMVLVSADGSELRFELTTSNLYARGGELERIVALAMPARRDDAPPRDPPPFGLLETQRQADEALASAGIGTWQWDATSSAVTWDAQTHRIFGHDVGTFPGVYASFLTLVHPEDRDLVNAEATQAMREKRPYAIEFRILWPDGSVHWVAVRGEVFGDDDGRLLEMRGACWDVTDRRQAAIQLERRLGFEQLLASVSTRLVRLGDAEIEEELPSTLEEIAEALGSELAIVGVAAEGGGWELAHSSIADASLSAALLELAQSEFPWSDRKADAARPATFAAPAASGLGAAIGIPLVVGSSLFGFIACGQRRPRSVWLADEVLFLHLAGEMIMSDTLRRQEARSLAALARVGRELIGLADKAAIRERVCRLTATALGCEAVLVCEESRQDAVCAVAQAGLASEVWRSLQGVSFDAGPCCDVHERLGFSASLAIPFESAEGPPGALVALRQGKRFRRQEIGVARGIAQLAAFALANAQLVEKVGQANRIKSDFIATMSHELRTPLNIILGYTDLLSEQTFGPLNEEQTDTLRRIGKSARNLLQMIEATLDAARIDAGHSRVCAGDVDPAAILQAVDRETRELRQGRGLEVEFRLDGEVPHLQTDGDKLRQILLNLVDNAIKFTPEGKVEVVASRRDGNVCFEIRDTGVGISATALPIIFDSFRQGDGSMTRQYGGVGLGLYIVRRLLDLMGGRVTVESAEAQGSTFTVWLPIGGEPPIIGD